MEVNEPVCSVILRYISIYCHLRLLGKEYFQKWESWEKGKEQFNSFHTYHPTDFRKIYINLCFSERPFF